MGRAAVNGLAATIELDRLSRGHRKVACDCGAEQCQGWAWARPDVCPPCLIGDHNHHMPVFFGASSWCPCPDCDPLRPPDPPRCMVHGVWCRPADMVPGKSYPMQRCSREAGHADGGLTGGGHDYRPKP